MDMYKLNGRIPVLCHDMMEWAEWYGRAAEDRSRVVASDRIGAIWVSTIFQGLDRSGSGFPLLWETAVFADDRLQYRMLYASWDEAAESHKEIVEAMRTATNLTKAKGNE